MGLILAVDLPGFRGWEAGQFPGFFMANSPTDDADNDPSTPEPPGLHQGRERARLVEKAIQSIEQKLGSNDVKATFADFIRLLQLQKELQVDQPREIKVTWVEPNEMESASEE